MFSGEIANDTIVALSSPVGRSGVGLIRMSGPQATEIIQTVFKARNLASIRFIDRHANYGFFINPVTQAVIDDGIVLVMKAPSSYTGEDTVEISLHGSPVILHEAIRIILSCGARIAQRGEFTRRAFLSGRMDLIQAEAVIDLIDSESLSQAGDARSRIDRRLSKEICSISSELKDIGAELEAFMDFDDDEEGQVPYPVESLEKLSDRITLLLKSSRSGRFRNRGLTAIITGKPNVGKSTLFNALLGEDRMIISPIPGTTRDPVSEKAYIKGVAVTLGDTAGIRELPDPVESDGIRKTLEWVDSGDIAIVVIDSSQPLDSDDMMVLQSVGVKPKMVVFNKIDKKPFRAEIDPDYVKADHVARTSARTGEGMESLITLIGDMAGSMLGSVEFCERGSLNDRAVLLMETAHENVTNALELLETRYVPELVSLEIRSACDKIDEITGQRFTDDVLDRIFERFCVGK